MKGFLNYKLMALATCFVFAACNSGEKTETSTTTEDSTQNKTETTDNSQAMDATVVAPAVYKIVKDTAGIRVLEVTAKPGDSTGMHSHPDNVLYVVDGGKVEFTGQDGNKQTVELNSGMSNISGPETHNAKNVGNTTVKAYLVEVNRPNRAATTDNPLDATKVASNFYKTVKDTLNIRTIMVDYKPSTSSALHSHPDLVMYAIAASKVEFTRKDGSKQEMQIDKGMIVVIPADSHSVKNIGNTNAKVLLVEVNRPVN